jgi:formamidopyrimidine-DNA glycosylase
MPELPEVETIRRDLMRHIIKKTVRNVIIKDPRVLRQSQREFIRRIKGHTIKAVNRRGKALTIDLSSKEHLIVQVMMTGQLVYDKPPVKHTRLVFKLSDGKDLLYNDQRVFGQLRVVKDIKEVKYFQIIGPEPFDQSFSPAYMAQKLKSSKRPIKNTLLDHTFVAGIGNIYACEILFRTKIDPRRPANTITKKEIALLHKQIIEVLNEAIDNRGSSMRNYRDGSGKEGSFKKLIRVYAREDKECLVCKTSIKREIQAGRSTFYCMKCQR